MPPVHDPNTWHGVLAAATVVLPPALARMPNHHPHIAHLMRGRFGYLFSDSLAATKLARKLRFPWVDKNAQADADDELWITHWADLWKGGWRWRFTGVYRHVTKGRGRKRRTVKVEVRERIPESDRHLMVINRCSTLTVSRLRSAKTGGTRPYTAEQHMAKCVAEGRKLALEVKGTVNKLVHYVRLAAAAARTGCQTVIMTLQSIGGWRRRLDYAVQVGFPAALLPRGPMPPDWHQYADAGVQVWGHWRRK